MSVSLSAERDRIQRQVEELEQSLSVTQNELDQLSSETDGESDDDTEEEDGQSATGLLAQREKIQKEIQNLEDVLGPHSPICVSDDDSSSSSDESELGLSLSVDSCLQMNLVYQQVVQETLDQLERLLTHNHRQQKEVMSQLSGPIKETSREQRPPSSCQQPVNMFLGRFLKPYFKDKLTGLGPPANQETKEKANRMTGGLDNNRLKVKRWESWQKILLIHSVARDGLRRLIQPKLSKVDYLSQKLSSAEQTDRQQLIQQIDSLEREIDLLRGKKEEELIGERYEEHDWQKISNIDFEGLRDAEDIRSFWQNFLHPSINKSPWSQEEVQQLKEVSRRHGERHWETIAKELGTGRTAFLCLQTFQRFVSDSLRRSSWTPAEDALLRELVDKMRIGNFIPYTQMSYFMEGRDPAQLLYRWNQVLDPRLKKGPWTKQEDQLLLQAVSRYGERDWWKIRLEVPGRTDSSCRDRYYDCLKADTKRGLFDKQEKELLRQLVEKHGVGHWAKIAAEIPHRRDGQCLREWRRLIKPAAPCAKRRRKSKNPPKSCGEAKKKKKTNGPAKRRIRRRLRNLKEEEEEEDEEDDETVVKYMDSDEEEKKEVVEETRIEEVEKEEEEEEYTFPPMKEWIPAEKAQCSFLSFQLVELSSSGDAHEGRRVRSTILGQFGRSVILGPPPEELLWEKRHSSSTMMMVSSDQLRVHLHRQANKFRTVPPRTQRRVQTSKRNQLRQMTSKGLDYELQAAVMPWIGNLLIPAKNKLIAADTLREQGEKTQMTSTPVFLLLLQTLNVDSVGCKEMIEKRRNKVPLMPHPAPPPVSTQSKNPNSVANLLLQQKDQQELDHQQQLVLKQLQVLLQQNTQKQLLRKQRAQQQPPLPHLPSTSSQSCPAVLLQMSPNMRPQMSVNMRPQMSVNMRPQMSVNTRPQMSPMLLPQPVAQCCAASVQLMPPSPLTTPPPLAVGVTSPSPAPPASQKLNVPPVSVPVPLNTTCSASLSQQAGPLIQNLKVDSSPFPNQRVSVGSTLTSPSGSTLTPLIRRRQKVSKDQQVVGSSQTGVDAGDVVGGACRGLVGSSDGEKEGRRKRKLTVKARALQEATEAKAEARRKSASSTRKKAQIQKTDSPRQTVVPAPPPAALQRPPPAEVVSSEAPSLPPVSVNGQNATPACSNTTLSSTESLHCTQPPSMLTNQHTASSTLSPPVPLHMDHDYSTGQDDSDSVQPSPVPKKQTSSHCKSAPAPNKSSKAPPRRRKRARVEEPAVCVGGAGTGVTRDGKRVRKPSQRARALQEATEAKAEAKKKRASSSPRKKRPRTSRSKQEVVIQNRRVTPPPGLCLRHGQSMWVMTPGGLLQLVEAPPQGLQLAFVPSFPATSPLLSIAPERTTAPIQPGQNQPQPLLAPTFILQAVPNPSPQPPPQFMLPYKGVVSVDPAAPPPLRREALQFDPTLMFQESREAVCDWLSGRGGVVVPGVGVALPYLPPFVSSLSMLSVLLRAKKCLTITSLRLLSEASKPRCPQTTPSPDSSTKETSNQPPDLPDSTSDLQPATDQSAPSVSSDQQKEVEEAELVAAVRQMVAKRFSSNPAYQLLKARFLSCFTVPALLATVPPITEKPVARRASGEEEDEEEEEEEEEEQLKKMKERGKQRRAERSSLVCDGSGAPATHFSGITTTSTPTTDRTEQTGPDPEHTQNVPDQ